MAAKASYATKHLEILFNLINLRLVATTLDNTGPDQTTRLQEVWRKWTVPRACNQQKSDGKFHRTKTENGFFYK